MSKRSLRVEIVEDSALDFILWPELCDNVGSLVFRVWDRVEDEIIAVAGLLNACRNVQFLRIHAPYVSGLSVLLTVRHLGLRELYLDMSREPEFSATTGQELGALLKQMPNLQRISMLPPSSIPLDGPEGIHLQHIFMLYHQCDALPMIISRRWTASRIDIYFLQETYHHLENVDWHAVGSLPEVKSLYIGLDESHENAAALALPFITACSAIRCLYLGARSAEIHAMLPPILVSCPGLRELELQFQFPTTPDDLAEVGRLLLDCIPKIHALRTLRIQTRESPAALGSLALCCQVRRIACSIRENFIM